MKKRKKTASVREVQHNLAKYLDIAQNSPITITKYGKEAALLVNPQKYEIRQKRGKRNINIEAIMNSEFIGMYENREDWQDKTTPEIAEKLRRDAWYGK
ncbi:hypothetical protein GF360_03550 [candidate division WWE3 bacterium]|nr:hypothetical protein [candidate division WWE3 bacterium]